MPHKTRLFLISAVAGLFLCSALAGSGYSLYLNRMRIIATLKAAVKRTIIPAQRQKRFKTPNPPSEIAQNGDITVTIKPSLKLAAINPLIYGSNLAPQMESEEDIIAFIKDTGITCLRYPGGGTPGYHWKTGLSDFSSRSNEAPLRNISYLVDFCKRNNTQLVIQVNVESGTAEEAAAWVERMNKQIGFPVQYWEIGNEVYGYWYRGHMSARNYARLLKRYSMAMKKVDPSIKIGANWGMSWYNGFNKTIIKEAADYIDFLSYHWYPNHTNATHQFKGRIHPIPKEVMSNALEIPYIVKNANDIIAKYAPKRKGKIEFTVLEWDGAWDAPNSDSPPYSQGIAGWSLANAIFYADCLGQFAKNKVQVATHYLLQDINFGLLRGWDRRAGWGGQRWDQETVRPKAFAIKLFSKYFGDILIESTVENAPAYIKEPDSWPDSYTGYVPYVACYASVFSNKDKLAIVLINKHQSKDFKVRLLVQDVKLKPNGKLVMFSGQDLMAENDANPLNVRWKEYSIENVKNDTRYTIPARSVNLLEFEIDKGEGTIESR